MTLHQLSLFLENRPGQLRAPCRALADAGIDILALSLADTAQFGILRLIVRDWEKARAVLQAAGMVVNVTEVIPVVIEDRVGALADLLGHLEEAGLGVEYLYPFAVKPSAGKAALLFRFERPEEAIQLLRRRGVNVLDAETLLSLKA
jgi:hypothetical protein